MEEADLEISKDKLSLSESEEEENDIHPKEDIQPNDRREARVIEDAVPATRVLKKKKLKINVHRPIGTRVVFDDEGNTLPPLARVAEIQSSDGTILLNKDKKDEFYRKVREEMKQVDKDQRRREKRTKEKMKLKKGRPEDNVDDEGESDFPLQIVKLPGIKSTRKRKLFRQRR